MTQFSIELSPDAKQQVDSITRYIAIELGNVSAALSFLDDVEASMENIRDNPYSHMVRSSSARIDGYPKRQFQFRKNFIMFYVILEDRNLIRILKVSYSWMDLSKD